MKPPKQDRLSRYARYALKQPILWLACFDLAVRHAPKNLRQYLADNVMLRAIEMQYGIRH